MILEWHVGEDGVLRATDERAFYVITRNSHSEYVVGYRAETGGETVLGMPRAKFAEAIEAAEACAAYLRSCVRDRLVMQG